MYFIGEGNGTPLQYSFFFLILKIKTLLLTFIFFNLILFLNFT